MIKKNDCWLLFYALLNLSNGKPHLLGNANKKTLFQKICCEYNGGQIIVFLIRLMSLINTGTDMKKNRLAKILVKASWNFDFVVLSFF